MATTGFPATGTYSAAITLVRWIQDHGREPRPLECCTSNGLMSHRTYYRRIPGSSFSAIVSMAFALVSGMPVPCGLSAVSATSSVKMRTCLGHGCERQFPYQGPQIGFCPKCRRKRSGLEAEWWEEATVTRIQLRKLGLEREPETELMEG